MDKTIFFMSGLPRSGSTLLCSILNQNDKIYATNTSGVLELILGIRTQWDKIGTFKTGPDNCTEKKDVLSGILPNYYKSYPNQYIIDKSRGWVGYIELLENILQHEVKIIAPVRSIIDIANSMEKLWRKNSGLHTIGPEEVNPVAWQTVEGRCESMIAPDGLIGNPLAKIKDALHRGHGSKIHFVEFENLVNNPKDTMEQIYNFLDIDSYEHDFNNVEQLILEDDRFHGIRGLHSIKNKVEPVDSDYQKYLSKDCIRNLEGMEFWRY